MVNFWRKEMVTSLIFFCRFLFESFDGTLNLSGIVS